MRPRPSVETLFASLWLSYHSASLDDLALTIAAIELLPDQAIEWTRPDDVVFNPATPLAGVGTIPADGLLVLMFDGSVKTINPAVTAQNF